MKSTINKTKNKKKNRYKKENRQNAIKALVYFSIVLLSFGGIELYVQNAFSEQKTVHIDMSFFFVVAFFLYLGFHSIVKWILVKKKIRDL